MSTFCPFCSPATASIFHEEELVIGIWDAFPASDGHALLVTRRHIGSWFEATAAERAALTEATNHARRAIQGRFPSIDHFNLGVNVGSLAGQTVPHLHVHVIPRRRGDVEDPRGGVRHVIPSKGNYLFSSSPPEAAKGTKELDLLSTGSDRPLLSFLSLDLGTATRLDVAVAFVMKSGVDRIYDHLNELLARNGSLRLLVGDYLDITDPDALQQLMDLRTAHPAAQVELRVFESRGVSFHPKAYIVSRATTDGVAYVGSSNLSRSALEEGVEWNFRVLASRDREGFIQAADAFEQLFKHPATTALDAAWLTTYRARRRPPSSTSPADAVAEPSAPPAEPNAVQVEALEALESTRLQGFTAGLVVLATGLGKTWLAAFDSDRPEFRRVLFVAHREEILSQALRTFRAARPRATFGFYDGEERTTNADVVFGSIQTLGKKPHLSRFAPDFFDYVVVDEFHHAAATTYRRLIEHFRPKFLIGLTATPERTDGGDLLALCQENLVYRQDLPEGIRRGLLSPFHYFGVPDEVDYENIPWRSASFDEEQLTTAVATNTRALNALEQWQQHGGGRTLAFCVSRRHADFMREFFRENGVRAAAVHSGETSDPRTSTMEKLASGELDVVFAVDIFNEGVDIPAIEVVLMLRPTESQILWLQQIGRGLRKVAGKTLKVIDYIGNHRVFLVKVRALLRLPTADTSTLAAALAAVSHGEFELPPGCEVTYDLRAMEILRGLLRQGSPLAALKEYYVDFRERMGRRPTALEAHHDHYSPRSLRQTHGSWLEFVDSMQDLDERQRRALDIARRQLRAIEVTPMTRSYKMLVVTALIDAGALVGPGLSIEELVRRVRDIAARNPILANDLGADRSDSALRALLEKNPISAWTGGRGTGNEILFAYEAGRFRCLVAPNPDLQPAFTAFVRELAEWRLAEYLDREEPSVNGSFKMAVSLEGHGLSLTLPDREKYSNVPLGWQHVRVDGTEYEANFEAKAVEILRRSAEADNDLPPILRGWFGQSAGGQGTRHDVIAEPTADGAWVLRPMGGSPVPKLFRWTGYSREQIPMLFGEKFSDAVWNKGYIVRPSSEDPQRILLLVTLDKEKMLQGHDYADHFLGPDLFQWQSQNQTARSSNQGQIISGHASSKVQVHLFVRPHKKRGRDTGSAAFVYCGELRFEDWQDDKPITVRWRLTDPVPPRLWTLLSVPQA